MAETIPASTPETDNDKCYSAPNPPPAPWGEYLRTQMDRKVFETYTANKVPWLVLKNMVDEEWTDIASVSSRFPDKATLYSEGAKRLGIEAWTPKQQEKVLARMAAAQDDLSLHKANKQRLQANPRAIQIVEDTDRRTMQQAFTAVTKEECPLRHQGSKHMLGKLNKAAAEGRVENLSNTEIVPSLPHPQTRSKTERRNNPDGTQEELEQEWRQAPAHADDWQEQMRVFYTTLMMAISVHQEHTKLEEEWDNLKDFYEEICLAAP